MDMSIDSLSIWLDAHQLLVVSIIIPLISVVVASLASWYSTHRVLRAEREKRDFQAAVKVVDFRQAWITELRNAMAEFQSYGVLPDANPSLDREFYQLGTKIELLMNPNDQEYKTLQGHLYSFLAVASGTREEKYRTNAEYLATCQSILKREWCRLKFDLGQK